MKRYPAILILLLLPFITWCQTGPWQQLRFKKDVQLFKQLLQIRGDMDLSYRNNSADTLTSLWVQLPSYTALPAYTMFVEAELAKGNAQPYFEREQKEKIRGLAFKVDANPAIILEQAQHNGAIQLALPNKLLPGDTIYITTPFEIQLDTYDFNSNKLYRIGERLRVNPPSQNFAILPVPGFNYYDKLMLGVLLHNQFDSIKKLHYFVLPMYATGSKQFNGIASMDYHFQTKHPHTQWKAGIQYATFTTGSNQFQDLKFNYRTQRLLPELTYLILHKKKLEAIQTSFRFRPYIFREEAYTSHNVENGNVTYYQLKKTGTTRYLNQLQLKVAGNRTLYPWEVELLTEQMDGLVKLSSTNKYYFNYNAFQGLSTRVFVGKMWQVGRNNLQMAYKNQRYNWNLSAAAGNQDYTYSNYFIARSAFEGILSQQTAMKDGEFKVSTPLLNSKLGSSNNWIAAVNLLTDIPKKLNPASLFPVNIPLQIFVDIGTTSTVWQGDKSNSGSRLFYDAGIQLALLKKTLNIYIPLLYSKQFRDYYKSVYSDKIFWKTITFNINIQHFKKAIQLSDIPDL